MAEITTVKVAVLCRGCGRAKLVMWSGRREAERLRCKRCAQRTFHPIETCPVCGTKFTQEREEQRYCSPICAYKAMRKRVPANCVRCGREMYLTPNQVQRRRKHCSWECLTKRIPMNCAGCNRVIYLRRSEILSYRHYCSRKCSAKHQSSHPKEFLLARIAAFEQKFLLLGEIYEKEQRPKGGTERTN